MKVEKIRNISKILSISGFVLIIILFLTSIFVENFTPNNQRVLWQVASYLRTPYIFLNILTPIAILVYISVLLFSSNWFKKIWEEKDTARKILSTIGNLVLIILASAITYFVIGFIGFIGGIYTM